MATTQYTQLAIANALFLGVGTVFPHADAYVGLFTADPGFFGLQTNEVSGGGYTRVQPTWGTQGQDSQTPDSDVNFPVATASWGTVTHVALLDSATGGNMLAYEPLPTDRLISTDDQVVVPSGLLTVTLSHTAEGSGINTRRLGVDYRRDRFIDVVLHGGTLIAQSGSWVGLSWGADLGWWQEVDTIWAPEYQRHKIRWEMTSVNPVTLTNTTMAAWTVLRGPGTPSEPGWLESMRTVQLSQSSVGPHGEGDE